jgi:hypothetical protein
MKNLFQAIAKVKSNVQSVGKTGKNPHFRSEYSTINDVLAVLAEPLAENDVTFVQMPTSDGLKTIVSHTKSGEYLEFITPIVGSISTMQVYGSGITYARRYSLISFFGLSDSDDDGNAISTPTNRAKIKLVIDSPEFAKCANFLSNKKQCPNVAEGFLKIQKKYEMTEAVRKELAELVSNKRV